MTTQHTPGPWTTDFKLYGGQYNVGPVTQPNMTVARVNGRDGEQEANARLIAEAPAMLEAIKELVAEHDERNRMDCELPGHGGYADTGGIVLARAILARIEGQP